MKPDCFGSEDWIRILDLKIWSEVWNRSNGGLRIPDYSDDWIVWDAYPTLIISPLGGCSMNRWNTMQRNRLFLKTLVASPTWRVKAKQFARRISIIKLANCFGDLHLSSLPSAAWLKLSCPTKFVVVTKFRYEISLASIPNCLKAFEAFRVWTSDASNTAQNRIQSRRFDYELIMIP